MTDSSRLITGRLELRHLFIRTAPRPRIYRDQGHPYAFTAVNEAHDLMAPPASKDITVYTGNEHFQPGDTARIVLECVGMRKFADRSPDLGFLIFDRLKRPDLYEKHTPFVSKMIVDVKNVHTLRDMPGSHVLRGKIFFSEQPDPRTSIPKTMLGKLKEGSNIALTTDALVKAGDRMILDRGTALLGLSPDGTRLIAADRRGACQIRGRPEHTEKIDAATRADHGLSTPDPCSSCQCMAPRLGVLPKPLSNRL